MILINMGKMTQGFKLFVTMIILCPSTICMYVSESYKKDFECV
jgi:hypothetical protein